MITEQASIIGGLAAVAAAFITAVAGPAIQRWRVKHRGPLDEAQQIQAMTVTQAKLSADFAAQVLAASVAQQADAAAARAQAADLLSKLRAAEAEADELIRKLRAETRRAESYGQALDANNIPRPIGA